MNCGTNYRMLIAWMQYHVLRRHRITVRAGEESQAIFADLEKPSGQ